MPFTCKVGDSFYLADSGGHHRYVIITKPNSDGNIVLVNFTSSADYKENLVIFRPKDSRKLFIKRTTVSYGDARFVNATRLAKAKIDNYEFCDLNHIKRIVIGGMQSRHTPLEIIEELKTQYPKEYQDYCSKGYSI
jgi:hypothetical protein